jgi:hypothetical protein
MAVPHLHDVIGSPTNTWSAVETELQSHADAIARSLAATSCDDNWFEGLQFVSPDGAIAQVGWQLGAARPALTRICRGFEADIHQPREHARAAREQSRHLWEARR